ncbi:zinc finger protein 226-like isoform X1 [Schistocerca piceifrons]|uniref:zinc finger protein 226-like isoform X1 n=1 Tax=Schistocerca piceifrons TaxID=274613 RepID=UPI001F5FC236|nr:zinc finger protein 226-like isoform X1 [Schistocerca piceifrons]
MEFAGEDIEIKEEPISTDPYQLPEIEQIYIKEENVKLETPEDNDARDPLNVEEDEFVSEEEAGSPPDAIHIKKEPEVQIEAEPTSCDSEPESIIAVGLVDDNRNGGNGSFVSRAEQPPASDSAMQCSTNQEVSYQYKSDARPHVHSCIICKKTFAHFQDLMEHSHVDTREIRHSCVVCHKTFTTTTSLKIHFRLHTGERPYSCDMCHKTFRRSDCLRYHVLRHVNQCPYICEVCHKTFMCRRELQIHSRVHTGMSLFHQ